MFSFPKYFLILFLFGGQIIFSQEVSIKGKAFVTENAVLLRWVPTDQTLLNYSIKYGYKIERALVADSFSMPVFETVLNKAPIKPLASLDSLWNTLIKKNPAAALAKSILYQQVQNTKKGGEIGFGLFLLSCDLDVEIAKACGFYFEDATIKNNEKYIYRISFYDAPAQLKMYEEKIFVDASKIPALSVINNLSGKFSDKKADLSWNVSNNKNTYASYIIERSEDSVTFQRVNTAPYVQLYSQYEKNKNEASYKDSLPQNGKYYFYRVKGLTHFGAMGPASNVIKGMGKSKLTSYPIIDTVYTIKNRSVFIEWRMPQGFNYNELKCYAIARGLKDNGPYIVINKKQIAAAEPVYVDSFPLFTNYYKVLAINKDNDTSYSFSWLVQLEDKEPPAVPMGLNGSIDTLGVVKLHWRKNNEADLKGYRIFRCNSLSEELTEVTKQILTDTVFRDSIVIKVLSKDIFYSITAVDMMFNNSDYAKPLLIKRPDLIAPVAPVIISMSGTDSCILIKWINSSSDDVEKYFLTKKEQGSDKIDTVSYWNMKDNIEFFRDKKINFGKMYFYTLTVFDDSRNSSSVVSFPFLFEPGVRPMIKEISCKADYDKRIINITWRYDYDNIYSFTVYKAKKGETLRVYKTISGVNKLFEDKDLKINNTYTYRIKAVFNNGAESLLSNDLDVQY